MARAFFPLYFDQYISLTTCLSDDECGRLFRAMLWFAKNGTELGLSEREEVVWPLIRHDIEQSKQAYERRCLANAANGLKGAKRRWGDEANDSDRHPSPANLGQTEETEKTNQTEKAEETGQAEQAGAVQTVETLAFEEKRRIAMAMLLDDSFQKELETRKNLQ